jgi:hypothetical protein
MKTIALFLSALILSACGGGGGGGAPAPVAPVASTSQFQLIAMHTRDFQDSSPQTFTIEGTVTSSGLTGTVAGSGLMTRTDRINTVFEGTAAIQKTTTFNGSANVTVAGTTTTVVLPPEAGTSFVAQTHVMPYLGSSSVGAYSVVAAPFAVPEFATVGQSGTFGTVNTYASSAKGAITGTTVFTWALTADTASTAILTITQTSRNASSALVSTQDKVYRVTPTGGSTLLRIVAVLIGTGTLTYTFQ